MPGSLQRVVVTGMGCITPYGSGVAAIRNGMLEGRSALQYNDKLKFVVSNRGVLVLFSSR